MDTLWEAKILCGKRVRQYIAAGPQNAEDLVIGRARSEDCPFGALPTEETR